MTGLPPFLLLAADAGAVQPSEAEALAKHGDLVREPDYVPGLHV
jgi:hypothetical protein